MQIMARERPRRFVISDRLEESVAEKFPPASMSEAPMPSPAAETLLLNRGIPLNLDWLDRVRVNTSAVERRTQTHTARRTVKKEWQAAWLLRAITCMDLTTLSGDDTDD